jgi:hypothetical protein
MTQLGHSIENLSADLVSFKKDFHHFINFHFKPLQDAYRPCQCIHITGEDPVPKGLPSSSGLGWCVAPNFRVQLFRPSESPLVPGSPSSSSSSESEFLPALEEQSPSTGEWGSAEEGEEEVVPGGSPYGKESGEESCSLTLFEGDSGGVGTGSWSVLGESGAGEDSV